MKKSRFLSSRSHISCGFGLAEGSVSSNKPRKRFAARMYFFLRQEVLNLPHSALHFHARREKRRQRRFVKDELLHKLRATPGKLHGNQPACTAPHHCHGYCREQLPAYSLRVFALAERNDSSNCPLLRE